MAKVKVSEATPQEEVTIVTESAVVEAVEATPEVDSVGLLSLHLNGRVAVPSTVEMHRPEGSRNVMVTFKSPVDGTDVSVARTPFIQHLFSYYNMSRKAIQTLLGGEDAIQYQAVFTATKGLTNAVHVPGTTPNRGKIKEFLVEGQPATKRDYVRHRIATGATLAELQTELNLAKGTISQMASGVARPKTEKPVKAKKGKKAVGASEPEGLLETDDTGVIEDFESVDDAEEISLETPAEDSVDLDDVFADDDEF